MNLGGTPNLGHLTYCTNIHAGENLDEVMANLRRHLPIVKQQVSPDKSMGVGLRLSASAVYALAESGARKALQEFLANGDFYVFTINGFPYGTFHGRKVKQEVYQPDWADAERLRYSNVLADVLAVLLPEGLTGNVSTVPGTFKAWAENRIDAIVDNIIRHVAHLVSLKKTTGKTIALALEPEPCCLLETIAETINFFQRYLFSEAAAQRLAQLTAMDTIDTALALRSHLGICYDVCHAAVEFEDAQQSIDDLQRAGLQIAKLQLSSALKISSVNALTLRQLQPFDEPVYLHQVVARHNNELLRFVDLPDAFAQADKMPGAQWRVHFHVPIFLQQLENFSTTQDFLREILTIHRLSPVTQQLEVETYTWDVLPQRYQSVDVNSAIARELFWVKEQLSQ